MSIAYGALTRAGAFGNGPPRPGVKGYVEVVAALVPAEILALHAAILPLATTTVTGANQQIATTITDALLLQRVFWLLVILSAAFFIVGHVAAGGFHLAPWDGIRMLIPPAAFVIWTMLQKATAFDAVWPDLAGPERAAYGMIAAAVLFAIATLLAYKVRE
jgi:hypothetical protein